MNSVILYLQHKPETLYMKMDETQTEILVTNNVNVSEGKDHLILLLLRSLCSLSVCIM